MKNSQLLNFAIFPKWPEKGLIIYPVPVHTQVTPATLLPPILLRFDVEGVESHSFQRRTCSATGGHGTNCNRTDEKYAARPGLEPGTLRLQNERSTDRATGLPTHNSASTCTYPSHPLQYDKKGNRDYFLKSLI